MREKLKYILECWKIGKLPRVGPAHCHCNWAKPSAGVLMLAQPTVMPVKPWAESAAPRPNGLPGRIFLIIIGFINYLILITVVKLQK